MAIQGISLVVEELLDGRSNGTCPDFVAFFVEMEGVGHDVHFQFAAGVDELVPDIEEVDFVVFGGEGLVALADIGAGDAEGVGGFFTAGEDAEEEDVGFGEASSEFFDDGLTAVDGFCGVATAVADVVGADEDHDDFGVEAHDFAVFEPPEDVLGAVAAESEVACFQVSEVCVPRRLAAAFPALGDGVAKEDDIDSALFGELDAVLVAVFPPLFAESVVGLGGDVLGNGLGGHGC